MERIWLKHYPKDIPHDITLKPHENLVSIYETACKNFAQRPADECLNQQISYAELFKLSTQFAAFCQQTLKLNPGDRIGIISPNLIQFHIVMFGALQADLTVVGINPLYTVEEFEYIFEDADLQAIVSLDFYADKIEKAIVKKPVEHIVLFSIGDMLSSYKRILVNGIVKYIKHMVPKHQLSHVHHLTEVLEKSKALKYERPQIIGEHLAFLQYTGGTTGRAKGVMLTHSNIVANVKQVHACLSPVLKGNEVWLAPLPMFHIFALTASLVPLLTFGAMNRFVPNPRDIKSFIKIAQKPFHLMTGVNTLFNALAHNEKFQELDFSELKMTWAGGMPVQRTVAEQWQKVTGCVLHVAYGLSETSPGVSADPYNEPEFSNSIGYPFPSTSISIRNEAGQEVPFGDSGEIWIKGPQVMKGYWNKPERTQEVLTTDGWFKSGDVGIMDETGRIRLVDRTKDMVIVSGFNVYTVEVEEIISKMPEVSDVAVLGIPHPRTGEAVKAHVVLKPGAHLEDKDIIEYCREHLARYKVPKLITFETSLPMNQVGKILKTELRKRPENINPPPMNGNGNEVTEHSDEKTQNV
ncbi:AMP-binding protein [Thiotrichales bacterium 19S3-7]|nr:AMP-binding protein [Thiotrichales bacterium 19S3-7]MCF6800602.1 AMP-binding protein [Thiotrichales bacterium 19S3-11]